MKKALVRISSISLLLSLFIHIGVMLAVYLVEKKPARQQGKPLDIAIIDADQLKALNEKKKDLMQIVDQNEKSTNEETPEKAKYLSRNNQKVFEETAAAQQGRFNNQAKQGMADLGKKQQAEDNKKDSKIVKNMKQGLVKDQPAPWELSAQKTKSGLPTLEALKPKFDWNKVAGAKSKQAVELPGQQSATDDYLKDVKLGAQTMLSTREFVYFSYYNRIKNQLQQYWEPKIKAKVTRMFQQGRQIASDQDRITRLRITLNEKGILVGVAVVNNSGVQELDEAAIEAFRAAAPFPNPPKGIVESDGTVKIDWSFILEASKIIPIEFQTARSY